MALKYLFFHYGPGGNCDTERSWLAARFPQIEFWNQPKTTTFDDLKQACSFKLLEFSKIHNHFGVIAHSFGCDLALHALHSSHVKADQLVLISPISSLFSAFENLAQKVLKKDPKIHKELSTALVLFQKRPSLDLFWSLVGCSVKSPVFPSLYWASSEKFKTFQETEKKSQPLDFQMWQIVLNDYISKRLPTPKVNAQHINVYLGDDDPYLKIQSDVLYWQAHLPGCHVLTVPNCGHYPHLEKPETVFANI